MLLFGSKWCFGELGPKTLLYVHDDAACGGDNCEKWSRKCTLKCPLVALYQVLRYIFAVFLSIFYFKSVILVRKVVIKVVIYGVKVVKSVPKTSHKTSLNSPLLGFRVQFYHFFISKSVHLLLKVGLKVVIYCPFYVKCVPFYVKIVSFLA